MLASCRPDPFPGANSKFSVCKQVNEKAGEFFALIKENVDENWNIVHEDGDMKVHCNLHSPCVQL